MICVTEYSLRIIRALFSCIGICHRPGAIIDVSRITIDISFQHFMIKIPSGVAKQMTLTVT
jgi:hypothetical protein